jgi:phosphate starvation-inducible membrane PsiE
MVRILTFFLYFAFGWLLGDILYSHAMPLYVDIPVFIGLLIGVVLDITKKTKSSE